VYFRHANTQDFVLAMDEIETNGVNNNDMLIDSNADRDNVQDTIVVEQREGSSDSSSLSSIRSTPSVFMFDPSNYPVGVYNDTVPSDWKFFVEINPKDGSFIREEYVLDEEEFNVVGIIGEIGEGDDMIYEVQFEDDHTAQVLLHF
jgi:hypothetical protein